MSFSLKRQKVEGEEDTGLRPRLRSGAELEASRMGVAGREGTCPRSSPWKQFR